VNHPLVNRLFFLLSCVEECRVEGSVRRGVNYAVMEVNGMSFLSGREVISNITMREEISKH
jgi:hypothetical protein